jgi:hypothetical protein
MLFILNFHYVDLTLRITFKPFIFNHLLKEFPELHYNDAMINRIYALAVGKRRNENSMSKGKNK